MMGRKGLVPLDELPQSEKDRNPCVCEYAYMEANHDQEFLLCPELLPQNNSIEA